jgi:hypothetical protein
MSEDGDKLTGWRAFGAAVPMNYISGGAGVAADEVRKHQSLYSDSDRVVEQERQRLRDAEEQRRAKAQAEHAIQMRPIIEAKAREAEREQISDLALRNTLAEAREAYAMALDAERAALGDVKAAELFLVQAEAHAKAFDSVIPRLRSSCGKRSAAALIGRFRKSSRRRWRRGNWRCGS